MIIYECYFREYNINIYGLNDISCNINLKESGMIAMSFSTKNICFIYLYHPLYHWLISSINRFLL